MAANAEYNGLVQDRKHGVEQGQDYDLAHHDNHDNHECDDDKNWIWIMIFTTRRLLVKLLATMTIMMATIMILFKNDNNNNEYDDDDDDPVRS